MFFIVLLFTTGWLIMSRDTSHLKNQLLDCNKLSLNPQFPFSGHHWYIFIGGSNSSKIDDFPKCRYQYVLATFTGWWFGTFFIFHNIWIILPIDFQTFIFLLRWLETTNQFKLTKHDMFFLALTLGSLGYEVKQRSWFQAHLQKPAVAAACTRRSAALQGMVVPWEYHGIFLEYEWNIEARLCKCDMNRI
jgi:hypothetical protein